MSNLLAVSTVLLALPAQDSSAVRIIRSPVPPAERQVSLVNTPPRFRLDGSEAGDDPFHRIPSPGGILALEGGFVVANSGAQQLRFFDGSGTWVTTAGRSGEGPGEFRLLSWMGLKTPDSLVTYDSRRRVVGIWTPDGHFMREAAAMLPADLPSGPTRGFVPPHAEGVTSNGSIVYLGTVSLAPGSGILRARTPIMRVRPESSRADTVTSVWVVDYQSVELPASPMIGFGRHVSTAIAGEQVSITEGDQFTIETYAMDGRHLRSIRVDRSPRRVTAADRELYLSTRPGSKPPFREIFPGYDALWLDRVGRLWALVFQPPTESTAIWDVFDQQGELLGSLEVPGSLRPQAADARFVYGVRTDEDGVQSVECYDLPEIFRTEGKRDGYTGAGRNAAGTPSIS